MVNATTSAGRGPRYFPFIDGLRAIAIAAVLAYHLDPRWMPGGFAGVDMFFVISGFVVSASVADFETRDAWAFAARFYARRVRRILPALLFCLVCVALLCVLFVPPAWLNEGSARTGLFAMFGLANFELAGSGNDYFSPRVDFNPYTHTWSLGVEEQFYLLFPLLFLLWLRGGRWRKASLAVFVVAGLASLGLAAWWHARGDQLRAFYLLPSRFWQLAAGVLLYQAFGKPVPLFAHVPLILGTDKKRLSKRHGATSVMEYAKQGYLPEAMVNFLALLGWSPGAGDRELFTADELKDVFDLRGISGGNAVFNPEKLDWFNQQYMLRLAPHELARRTKPYFEAAGLWSDDLLGDRHAWFFAILELLKVRAKRLDEYPALGRFFFTDDLEWDEAAVKKHLAADGAGDLLKAASDALAALPVFDPGSIEAAVRGVAEARGVKAGVAIHPLRVALTGKTVSPGLFEVAALLGRERVERRIAEGIRRGHAARA